MTLSGGTRLGHYQVVRLLGAGGMGEVYRATDTKLDGKRFAVLKAHAGEIESATDKVTFILNFFDELRRIAPVK